MQIPLETNVLDSMQFIMPDGGDPVSVDTRVAYEQWLLFVRQTSQDCDGAVSAIGLWHGWLQELLGVTITRQQCAIALDSCCFAVAELDEEYKKKVTSICDSAGITNPYPQDGPSGPTTESESGPSKSTD